VNRVLRALLVAGDGIVRRSDAIAVLNHDVLDRAVRSGQLIRPYPGILLDPGLRDDRAALIRAAVAYADGRAAVSHLSGLALWRLPVPDREPVHLTSPTVHRLRGAPGLVVHRRAEIDLAPPDVVVRNGCPVTRLERCIVDSWPMLDGDGRRAPAIGAVARRMTTPERLRLALDETPRLGGRQHLRRLVDLLEAGCRSELELWGYAYVFRGFQLRWQVPVQIDGHAAHGRTVYLDVYDEIGRVNFELDGAKYHASAGDRERDLRRDAALAVLGITVVRFTHDRLLREPGAVRRQIREIMAARRMVNWVA
jgi:very-short-patch-repair endonuclease